MKDGLTSLLLSILNIYISFQVFSKEQTPIATMIGVLCTVAGFMLFVAFIVELQNYIHLKKYWKKERENENRSNS